MRIINVTINAKGQRFTALVADDETIRDSLRLTDLDSKMASVSIGHHTLTASEIDSTYAELGIKTNCAMSYIECKTKNGIRAEYSPISRRDKVMPSYTALSARLVSPYDC